MTWHEKSRRFFGPSSTFGTLHVWLDSKKPWSWINSKVSVSWLFSFTHAIRTLIWVNPSSNIIFKCDPCPLFHELSTCLLVLPQKLKHLFTKKSKPSHGRQEQLEKFGT
jgi:hypothetical protein